MEYFKISNFDIYYCDSTESKLIFDFPKNITYKHLPNKSFSEKILLVLKKIQTNYVALCADDDFLSIDTLNKYFYKIKNNEKISLFIGNNLQFNEHFDDQFFTNKLYKKKDFDLRKNENVKLFLNDYRQVLWGLYSKTILIMSLEIICKAKFKNDNFIELVLATISSYFGKIVFVNDIWSVRELSNNSHWATRHLALYYHHSDYDIKNDMIIFKNLVDSYTENGISEIALNQYLPSNFFIKIKYIIKYYLKIIVSPRIRFFLRRLVKKKNIDYLYIEKSIDSSLSLISKILSK